MISLCIEHTLTVPYSATNREVRGCWHIWQEQLRSGARIQHCSTPDAVYAVEAI